MNPSSSTDSRVTLRARFRTATREAILEAAADLLGAAGGSQTRMEDIAARAGIAVGTLYNYFEDRKALVSALLESRTKALMDALDAAVSPGAAAARSAGTASSGAAGSFEADLSQFVSAFAAHFESNRFLLGVLREEEQERGVDARAATRRSTVLGELLDKAERLMDRGIRSRVLRKEDPALYAAMLVGMLRGVALSALTRRTGVQRGGTAVIVRQFMSGAAR